MQSHADTAAGVPPLRPLQAAGRGVAVLFSFALAYTASNALAHARAAARRKGCQLCAGALTLWVMPR